jgi:hypothetical protein
MTTHQVHGTHTTRVNAGYPIRVKEADGDPSLLIHTIEFEDGSLTDNQDGTVTSRLTRDHAQLDNREWSVAAHTIDTDIDMKGHDVNAVGAITLDTAYVESGNEPVGTLWWNDAEQTCNLRVAADVILQVGQEMFFEGANHTGTRIEDGTPVMFAGTTGNSGRLLIQPAIADGSLHPSYTMGILTEGLDNGESGKVTWFGKTRGFDTTGTPYGETWHDGDILYISPTTAGYLTNVEPEAPDRRIRIAVVVHAHQNGTLVTRPTFSSRLTELDDVDGTPLTTSGQILVWNSVNGYFDASHNINAIVKTALSSDPAAPPNNSHIMWQSDGSGSGDDGDIMIKITNSLGTTKTATLIDFSALP